mgnify:CR=1 FL=1
MYVYRTADGTPRGVVPDVRGAQSIVLGADGLLYVCAEKVDQVVRIDPETRVVLDVRSFLDPSRPGTEVSSRRTLPGYPVKALATISGQALVQVSGKGMLGVPDGRTAMIDAIHHAAHAARSRTLDAARELLQKHRVDTEPAFLSALEAVLEVLPVGKGYATLDLPDAAQGAGADFDALESLRRLAFAEQVGEPEQLKLWALDEVSAKG